MSADHNESVKNILEQIAARVAVLMEEGTISNPGPILFAGYEGSGDEAGYPSILIGDASLDIAIQDIDENEIYIDRTGDASVDMETVEDDEIEALIYDLIALKHGAYENNEGGKGLIKINIETGDLAYELGFYETQLLTNTETESFTPPSRGSGMEPD